MLWRKVDVFVLALCTHIPGGNTAPYTTNTQFSCSQPRAHSTEALYALAQELSTLAETSQ